MQKIIPLEMPVGLRMSDEEFKHLGLDEVGYIKPYRVSDGIAWVLHAADGAAIAVQKDAAGAVHSAQAQDLALATLH
jgi:hypothetical protein